jgi:hypothetical protein
MASDSDKIKLLEFLLKLEADSGYLKDFVEGDEEFRTNVVESWKFENADLAAALVRMDSLSLQDYMNPTTVTIRGWVKAPPSG